MIWDEAAVALVSPIYILPALVMSAALTPSYRTFPPSVAHAPEAVG